MCIYTKGKAGLDETLRGRSGTRRRGARNTFVYIYIYIYREREKERERERDVYVSRHDIMRRHTGSCCHHCATVANQY